MSRLEGVEDTYPLFQPGHLQLSQGCILRLFDTFELHLEEIDLELLVDLMVFKLVVHSNVAMEAPIPIFPDCFVQS